jgi:hypothetical protein
VTRAGHAGAANLTLSIVAIWLQEEDYISREMKGSVIITQQGKKSSSAYFILLDKVRMRLRRSRDFPQHGYQLRLMSPLGTYPDETFLGANAALVIAQDICFSMVRLQDEWEHNSFSEVDPLNPTEIPLFGALMLAVDGGERYMLPYPTHQAIVLRAAPGHQLDAAAVDEGLRWMRAYIKRHKLELDFRDVIHRPPIAGGVEYDLISSRHRDAFRDKILVLLQSADQVTLRGLSSLMKANMAWEHLELNEAGCVSLWISLDAIHSLILQRLIREGRTNPTSQDASNYIASRYGIDFEGSIFEDDHYNRIRVIHPENRFGAEARPQLLADDFYELRHLVVELFHFLVTGVPTNPSGDNGEFKGHAFHRRPL